MNNPIPNVDKVTDYEIREDKNADGTPAYDVYAQYDGDSEYIETFSNRADAVKFLVENGKRTPYYLAQMLIEYGLYGAGGDDTPEQQTFGADCAEAGLHLLHLANEHSINCAGREMLDEIIYEKVMRMRTRAVELRREEKESKWG